MQYSDVEGRVPCTVNDVYLVFDDECLCYYDGLGFRIGCRRKREVNDRVALDLERRNLPL